MSAQMIGFGIVIMVILFALLFTPTENVIIMIFIVAIGGVVGLKAISDNEKRKKLLR